LLDEPFTEPIEGFLLPQLSLYNPTSGRIN